MRWRQCHQPREFGDGAIKLSGFNGLQQIVNRVHFKSAQGVFVVSRSEDNQRLMFEASEQFKAVEAGHLNVEEKRVYVIGGCLQTRERVLRIAFVPDDFDARVIAQQARKPRERELLVINQKEA
jgi:hypothetical protein